jgi:hypothetical protein
MNDGQHIVQLQENMDALLHKVEMDKWAGDRIRAAAKGPAAEVAAVYDTLSNAQCQQYANGVKSAAVLRVV